MAVGHVRRPSTSAHCLLPPLIALWDTKKQKCTSNPACELWDEMMLLNSREREREAIANRAAQPVPRPAPVVGGAPRFPAFGRARGVDYLQPLFGPGGMFVPAAQDQPRPEPPLPEPPRPAPPRPEPPRPEPRRPEPPRIVAQNFGFNDGGDFDWIDDPSTCTQFATAFAILTRPQPTRRCWPHPSIHPRDDHKSHLRVL